MAINAIGGINSTAVDYDRRIQLESQTVGTVTTNNEAVARTEADANTKVIGISSDGDTARASEESISSLNEGFVFAKTENQTVQTEDSSEDRVGSLNGFSSNQLEAMYRQGRISKHDYDSEVDRRDRITEKDSADEETKNVAENAAVTKKETVSGEEENKAAEANRTSDEDKVTNDSESDDRKNLITEEMEQYNGFLSEMNNLESRKEDISLREKNIQEVFDNERVDIMNQIYNQDAGIKVLVN